MLSHTLSHTLKILVIMTTIHIELAQDLSNADAELLRRYLTGTWFSAQEWQGVRAAIDRLARSSVVFQARRYPFRAFYDTFINGAYAYQFLREIGKLTDFQRESSALQAGVARKIVAWLLANSLTPGAVPGVEFLHIYCLYRWAIFARGYIFEQLVLRDLNKSGVGFLPHLPDQGATERFSRFDLFVNELGGGDIKASLYFLDDLPEPPADFYITKLYDNERRQLWQVVFLSPAAWQKLGGETPQPSTIATAAQKFPRPLRIEIGSRRWVVVEYKAWKVQLRQHQLQGGRHDG